MAKVTITFEDDDEGSVKINMVMDPPIKANEEATPAAYCAFACLQNAKDMDGKD